VFDPAEILELGVQFDVSATSVSAQPGVLWIDTLGC
jgi:hypothetical protein